MMFAAYGSKTMVLPPRSRTSRVSTSRVSTGRLSCATAAAPQINIIATLHIRSMAERTENKDKPATGAKRLRFRVFFEHFFDGFMYQVLVLVAVVAQSALGDAAPD